MRRVMFLIFFALLAPSARAQDPVAVDAKHYKVLFQNDQVRVLKIHYDPKEKSVMHEHPASVVVFLSTSKAKFTLPDGTTTTDGGGKAGQIRYTDAGKHLPENIGSTPVEAVLVELIGKSGTAAAVSLDPVKVDPSQHKLEFENDRVRVLRITLKPHLKTKVHEHPQGVAIYLADTKAKITLADGKTREANGKRGDAIWAEPEKHAVESASSKPAQVILVELK